MCRVYLYLLVVLGVVVAGCKDGNVHYVDFAYSSEFATPLLVAAADHLFDFTNEYTDDDTGQTCTRLYVYRPVDFASDASVTARLDDKSLEIGTISSIAFSAAVGREVDIAGVSISHIDGESNGLVMRDFFLNPSKLSVHTSDSGPPSSPVARRKIATVPFSCSSFQLSAFIELFSLDDDIDVLFMESNAIEDAWNNGDIDGAFVHGKTFEFLQSQGGHVIITAKRMSDWGEPTFHVVAVRRSFADKHPHAVARYLKVAMLLVEDYKSDIESGISRWAADSDYQKKLNQVLRHSNVFPTGSGLASSLEPYTNYEALLASFNYPTAEEQLKYLTSVDSPIWRSFIDHALYLYYSKYYSRDFSADVSIDSFDASFHALAVNDTRYATLTLDGLQTDAGTTTSGYKHDNATTTINPCVFSSSHGSSQSYSIHPSLHHYYNGSSDSSERPAVSTVIDGSVASTRLCRYSVTAPALNPTSMLLARIRDLTLSGHHSLYLFGPSPIDDGYFSAKSGTDIADSEDAILEQYLSAQADAHLDNFLGVLGGADIQASDDASVLMRVNDVILGGAAVYDGTKDDGDDAMNITLTAFVLLRDDAAMPVRFHSQEGFFSEQRLELETIFLPQYPTLSQDQEGPSADNDGSAGAILISGVAMSADCGRSHGRGEWNHDLGRCECSKGYFGPFCQQQWCIGTTAYARATGCLSSGSLNATQRQESAYPQNMLCYFVLSPSPSVLDSEGDDGGPNAVQYLSLDVSSLDMEDGYDFLVVYRRAIVNSNTSSHSDDNDDSDDNDNSDKTNNENDEYQLTELASFTGSSGVGNSIMFSYSPTNGDDFVLKYTTSSLSNTKPATSGRGGFELCYSFESELECPISRISNASSLLLPLSDEADSHCACAEGYSGANCWSNRCLSLDNSGKIDATSGRIISKKYDDQHSVSSHFLGGTCAWTIRHVTAKEEGFDGIKLLMSVIDMEPIYDYVRIYDPRDETGSQLFVTASQCNLYDYIITSDIATLRSDHCECQAPAVTASYNPQYNLRPGTCQAGDYLLFEDVFELVVEVSTDISDYAFYEGVKIDYQYTTICPNDCGYGTCLPSYECQCDLHYTGLGCDEVEWVSVSMPNYLRQVVIFLVAIMFVAVGLVTVFVYKHRYTKIFMAGSVNLHMITLGVLLVLTLLPLFYLLPVVIWTCKARLVLSGMCVNLLMSVTFMKLYRIDRLLNNRSLEYIRFDDWKVVRLAVMPIVMLVVISIVYYLVLWGDGDDTVVALVYEEKDFTLYRRCRFNQLGVIYVLFFLILLTWGAVLSYKTRAVPGHFNESREQTSVIYCSVFYCCVIFPIQFALRDDPDFDNLIQISGVFFQNLSLLIVLFLPKILAVADGRSNESRDMFMEERLSSGGSYGSASAGPHLKRVLAIKASADRHNNVRNSSGLRSSNLVHPATTLDVDHHAYVSSESVLSQGLRHAPGEVSSDLCISPKIIFSPTPAAQPNAASVQAVVPAYALNDHPSVELVKASARGNQEEAGDSALETVGRKPIVVIEENHVFQQRQLSNEIDRGFNDNVYDGQDNGNRHLHLGRRSPDGRALAGWRNDGAEKGGSQLSHESPHRSDQLPLSPGRFSGGIHSADFRRESVGRATQHSLAQEARLHHAHHDYNLGPSGHSQGSSPRHHDLSHLHHDGTDHRGNARHYHSHHGHHSHTHTPISEADMARLDMRRSAEGGGDRRDYGDEQNYSSDAESSSQESHRNRLQRPLAFLASDTDSNIRPDLAMAGYELPSCAHSGMNANQSDMMGDSHLFTHELPRVQSAERADDVHLRDGKEHPASGDFNDSLPRRHALRSCNSANGSDIVSSASTSFAIEESVHVERSPTAIMIEKMQRTVAGNSGTGNGVGFAGIEVSSGHAIARSGVLPPLPAALSAGTYTAALGEERVRRRDQFK